jgi:hypothetical protein
MGNLEGKGGVMLRLSHGVGCRRIFNGKVKNRGEGQRAVSIAYQGAEQGHIV